MCTTAAPPSNTVSIDTGLAVLSSRYPAISEFRHYLLTAMHVYGYHTAGDSGMDSAQRRGSPCEPKRGSYCMACLNARRASLGAVLIVALFAGAASSHGESSDNAASIGNSDSDAVRSLDEERSKWFFVFGAANVQPRLKASGKQIDEQINGIFGAVLPRWEEPRTFRDWRDEFRLWDLHVGLGRELSPKWVWMSTVGGSIGTVRNEDRYYPLGVPAMFNVDSSRKIWFASTGMHY